MNKKCSNCHLINFSSESQCRRCGVNLIENPSEATDKDNDLSRKLDAGAVWLFARVATALVVSLCLLIVAYLSMLYSAAPLTTERQLQVQEAIDILESRGFEDEAFWLRWSAFRANDNWFNALTGHADAYAATNFPFQIVTLYDEFFTLSVDATERAAVLLHEAQHLKGAGEPQAYGYVWRNRRKLGWTPEVYAHTRIYQNVQSSTRQITPFLFRCDGNPNFDCTEQ